jgi:predicted Zn-dependent protease
MRLLLSILGLAAAAVIAFSLGRHLPRRQDPIGRSPAAADTHAFGGSTPRDTFQGRRSAALRAIAEQDTYLPYMLSQDDSVLKRWASRSEPLSVFLPDGAVRGFTPQMADAARNAFGRWERVADIPVRFTFVRDSAHADVQVKWIEAFPMRRTGQADLVWRRDGWLQTGSLTLATHTQDGDLLTSDAVYTVALHEIGHLLGLDHSDDSADVMFQSTEIHDITARDRRTARLLYAIPPGSYKVTNR